MATRRFSYKDDWVLKDGNIGINSETPAAKLDVGTGTIKAENIKGSGITTLTTYSGYLNKNTGYLDNVTINSGDSSTLSGEVVIGTGLTMTIGTGATTGQGSIDSLKVSNTFTPPIGGTDERPSAPKPGALFYNKDFKTIEYWDGNYWRQVDNTTASGRGILGGSYAYPVIRSNIDYINIPTKGNSLNFGELSEDLGLFDAAGSSTRMVFSGAYKAGSPYIHNDMEYITIAAKGNSIDFGSLSSNNNTYGTGACSSSTRMLIPGGNAGSNVGTNIISYIQINTLGDATDFGDLVIPRGYPGGTGSSVRAIIVGNYSNDQGVGGMYTAETVNYASKGNAITFGDMTEGGFGHGASNSVRSIYGGTSGGSNTYTNNIDYVNIASLGNGQSFGERTTYGIGSAMSSGTRVVMTGGELQASPYAAQDIMDYVEITTSGVAQDFGDAAFPHADCAGSSDCHGGLGGF